MPNTNNSNFRLPLLDAFDAETTLGCPCFSLPGSGTDALRGEEIALGRGFRTDDCPAGY